MTVAYAPGSVKVHPIAAIRYAGGVAIDDLLQEVAEGLAASGVRLGGFIQQASVENDDCCAVMHLRDLRDGSRVTISQELGPGAKGCRLDPAALARVAARLEETLEADIEILVLNRFGKAEAEGGGLCATIQKAIGTGIPVLLAVRDEQADAWTRFHGGLGLDLPAERAAIVDWCSRAVRTGRCP